MAGKACIRGTRVTVSMIVGQVGAGRGVDELLAEYPYLEREDILQAPRFIRRVIKAASQAGPLAKRQVSPKRGREGGKLDRGFVQARLARARMGAMSRRVAIPGPLCKPTSGAWKRCGGRIWSSG
jgi:uncharacterized protein (DUF433 family)